MPDTLPRIIEFLTTIGLPVHRAAISSAAVVPGIYIDRGTLLVDESQLKWPGDLLHEAGHLAILLPQHRMIVTGTAGEDPGFEMAAIAWSWAALVHLRLDPAVVFHQEGYRGSSESLIENFRMSRFVGLPMLRWMGMIADERHFPAISRWLRE